MLGITERTGHIATTEPQEHGRSACIVALALQGIEYLVDFFHYAIGYCHHYPALLSQYKAVIALRVYDAKHETHQSNYPHASQTLYSQKLQCCSLTKEWRDLLFSLFHTQQYCSKTPLPQRDSSKESGHISTLRYSLL